MYGVTMRELILCDGCKLKLCCINRPYGRVLNGKSVFRLELLLLPEVLLQFFSGFLYMAEKVLLTIKCVVL